MNKVLIVALAVCLVSVHAFVKRDAEKTEPTSTVDYKKEIEDFAKQASDKVNKLLNSDKIKEALDPETVKKQFGDALDPEKVKKQFGDAVDAIKRMFDTNAEATTEKKE